MAFWIVCSMKAIKEQIDEQPKIIKLFSVNYARYLQSNIINILIFSIFDLKNFIQWGRDCIDSFISFLLYEGLWIITWNGIIEEKKRLEIHYLTVFNI